MCFVNSLIFRYKILTQNSHHANLLIVHVSNVQVVSTLVAPCGPWSGMNIHRSVCRQIIKQIDQTSLHFVLWYLCVYRCLSAF